MNFLNFEDFEVKIKLQPKIAKMVEIRIALRPALRARRVNPALDSGGSCKGLVETSGATIRARLATVRARLATVRARLATVRARLAKVRARLDTVRARLA